MEYRLLVPGERMKALELCRRCFPEDDEAFARWYFERRFKFGQAIGAFDAGELVCFMLWSDVTIALGGAQLYAPSVAYVCTDPRYRGKGLNRELTEHTLRVLKDAGCSLCTLYPFNYGFYRKLGWEDCYRVLEAELPQLKSEEETPFITIADPQHVSARIADAYAAAMARYDGFAVRDANKWMLRLEEAALYAQRAMLVNTCGKTNGYALYSVEDDAKRVEISEIIASDEEDYRHLLTGMKREYSGFNLTFSLPADMPLFSVGADMRKRFYLEPGAMGRIVDLCALSGKIKCGVGEAVLRVRDEIAPWNEGVFRLFSMDGRLWIEPCADAQQGEISIGGLAQLLWGYCGAGYVKASGALRCDKDIAETIGNLFIKRNCFLFEKYG